MDVRLQNIISWLREQTIPSGGLLVPVSGGTDSALCLFLCAEAYPGLVRGVYAGTALRERAWFGRVAPIYLVRQPVVADVEDEIIRWAKFLAMSNRDKRALVGTRNRTEDVFGTYSLASRVATILPLVGLWKSEIMGLAASVGIPEAILVSSTRADPDCGRPVELAEISLDRIDLFLQVTCGEREPHELSILSDSEQAYLTDIYQGNAFKANLPFR